MLTVNLHIIFCCVIAITIDKGIKASLLKIKDYNKTPKSTMLSKRRHV